MQKQFGPENETVYLKGNLLFIDFSILEIAIFANKLHNEISIDKYRFHYMDKEAHMLFRYDNAPHHPEIPSFPHHKHTSNKTVQSNIPCLKDVLNEITAIIIKR
ncbi:MAG: hypothetical protein A2Z50_03310 [Nitrospirae bacterium RBG_19FT_COMBO_42_15]|nr:MAG: hypothetical protein A2Z50_03310 [Nitrospirae bacterium RBG_19FT_COMBO_42_15]